MGKIIRNGIEFSGTSDSANNINYDNSVSGLEARTAQEAIDTLSDSLGNKKILCGSHVINSSNWESVTFEKEFSSIPIVTVSHNAMSSESSSIGIAKVSNITTSGFRTCVVTSSGYAKSVTVNWIAIGN